MASLPARPVGAEPLGQAAHDGPGSSFSRLRRRAKVSPPPGTRSAPPGTARSTSTPPASAHPCARGEADPQHPDRGAPTSPRTLARRLPGGRGPLLGAAPAPRPPAAPQPLSRPRPRPAPPLPARPGRSVPRRWRCCKGCRRRQARPGPEWSGGTVGPRGGESRREEGSQKEGSQLRRPAACLGEARPAAVGTMGFRGSARWGCGAFFLQGCEEGLNFPVFPHLW